MIHSSIILTSLEDAFKSAPSPIKYAMRFLFLLCTARSSGVKLSYSMEGDSVNNLIVYEFLLLIHTLQKIALRNKSSV